jgi:hypothetical protein
LERQYGKHAVHAAYERLSGATLTAARIVWHSCIDRRRNFTIHLVSWGELLQGSAAGGCPTMFRMRCCNQHRGREVLIPLFVSFLQASWNWLLIFSARDRCMAYNQNGILNRSDHKRTSYPRFVLVSETECGDWLIKLVQILNSAKPPSAGFTSTGASRYPILRPFSVSPNANSARAQRGNRSKMTFFGSVRSLFKPVADVRPAPMLGSTHGWDP